MIIDTLAKSLAEQIREAVDRYLTSEDVDEVLKDDPILLHSILACEKGLRRSHLLFSSPFF